MTPKTTLIACVTVCAAAGFVVGRISSEPTPSSSMTESSANTRCDAKPTQRIAQRHGPRTSKRRFASSSSLAQNPTTRMESIINNPDPLDRAAEWLHFIKGLDSLEIKQLVVEFHDKGLATSQLSEFSMLLTAWATTDAKGAIRWAEEHHEARGANPWMVGVISGIADSDLALASELLSSMPHSRERDKALSAVQGYYLKQGPEAARNWALGIKIHDLRSEAIALVAVNLARTDPMGTANWLLANPSEASRRAMGSVMQRMAERDPQTAISYLNSIEDPSLQSRALIGLTHELAASDPKTALFVMDANPVILTDDVIQEFVWNARQQDPELAASTIERIENPRQKNHTYRRYLSHWLRRDANAAVNWVNQNEVPDDVHRFVEITVEGMRDENR